MRKIVMTVVAGAAILASGLLPSEGGELYAPRCGQAWRCRPDGCGWQHVCRRVCPGRYSCSPLYGAYGPFGGTAFWGAYTGAGWGYRRW